MPMSKFIPSYHHHFAKQCRVSDYGYSKLLELLEAVPHVLQVSTRMTLVNVFICRLSMYGVFFTSTIDFGTGYQAVSDPDPPCSSEALHPRPTETT